MIEKDPLFTLGVAVFCVEAGAFVLLLLAWRLVPGMRRAWRGLWRRLGAVASRPRLSLVVVAAVGAGVPAVLWGVSPREPRIQDEFSYLLAADTFARGRLTNPTPDFWRHIETEHVIVRPSYSSKYPPGQGLVLAAGRIAAGSAIVAVFVMAGVASAGATWCARAFVPDRWAMAGGLLVALHPGMAGWWAHSYWGGHLAVLGGALVLGGAARLGARSGVGSSAAMAAGLAILAMSRPWEGLAAAIPAGAYAAAHVLRRARRGEWSSSAAAVVPAVLIVAVAGAFLLAHNRAVTGDPLKMPYAAYVEQYNAAPMFLFAGAPTEPAYRHEAMRDFHVKWDARVYRRHDSARRLASRTLEKVGTLWAFFVGVAFTPAIVAAAGIGRRRATPVRPEAGRKRAPPALAWSTAGAVVGASLLVPWSYPHYVAPGVAGLVVVLLVGLRRLRARGRGGLIAAALGARAVGAASLLIVVPLTDAMEPWGRERARIEDRIAAEAGSGGAAIVVRYAGEYDPHREWVYNGADAAAARVLWLRETGERPVREVLGDLAPRRAWLLVTRHPALPPDRPLVVECPVAPAWMYAPPALWDGEGPRGAAQQFAGRMRGGEMLSMWIDMDRQVLVFDPPRGDAVLLSGKPLAVAAGDVNGDGLHDAVVACAQAGHPCLNVCVRSADGTFSQPAWIALPGAPTGLWLRDVDGDGVADVLLEMASSEKLVIRSGQ